MGVEHRGVTGGRRTLAVVLGLLALAVGPACSSSKGAAAAAPTTTTLAPTSTSTTVGVDQIPPVITVEYAQRVMDALDKAEGDATRMLYAAKVPTPAWRDRLVALYDGKGFDLAEADYGRDAADGFSAYRNPPGDPKTTVTQIDDSSATCIVLSAKRDFGPYLMTEPPAGELSAVVILRPKNAARDPGRFNPTAWIITGDGKPKPGADLGHACDPA